MTLVGKSLVEMMCVLAKSLLRFFVTTYLEVSVPTFKTFGPADMNSTSDRYVLFFV